MMARKNAAVTAVSGEPGIPIDFRGDQAIDPTKNVLDLVKALEATLAQLREADAKRLDDLRHADNKRQDDLRESDTKRLSELASQKDRYDRQIFDIQTVQVKTTSDLISAQLSKETASLANQINASTLQTQGLISTLSERIRVLEQARSEVFGRSSVSDPATADALARMASGISALSSSTTDAMNKTTTATADAIAKLTLTLTNLQTVETRSGGAQTGRGMAIQWIVQAAMLFAAVATPLIALFAFLALRAPHP
jgi:hypothetical protein